MTHENGSDTMVMLISIPVIYGSVRNGARIRFRCQNIMMVPVQMSECHDGSTASRFDV